MGVYTSNEIRGLIRDAVVAKGLPVLHIRDCADSDYGLLVVSPEEVKTCGYAREGLGDKVKLADLNLVDLAYLLEDGMREDDQDFAYYCSTFEEE